jgi:molybdopterin-guanine dinucleotide biosynthesis protein A
MTSSAEHQTLQSTVTSVVVAAGQVDRYEIPGIRTIGDPLPACGSLGGVLAALEDSAADAVIILACDLPFVTTELIRLLVETEPSSSLVVPSVGGDVQPLAGVTPSR